MKTKTTQRPLKQTVESLISAIIAEASDKLGFEMDDKYVAVCVYNCGGSWDVWLNWGISGHKAHGEVLVNGSEYYGGHLNVSLIKTLRTFLGLVQEKTIEAI